VDEALEHRLAAVGVERLAVEVVLDEIGFLDQLRRNRSRQVVALRVARRAQADVAVGVDDAVRREDAVSRDQVFQFFRNRLPANQL
jgi:hypothetical protein